MTVDCTHLARWVSGRLLLTVMILAGCNAGAAGSEGEREASPSPSYTTQPVQWMLADDPDPESITLTITVALGGCATEVASTEVEETAAAVTIQVLARVLVPADGWDCLAIQVPTDINVRLDEPLGQREITGDLLVDSI